MYRYQAKLASRPLLTQSATTLVLFATGDTMAQQLVEKRGLANQDLARTSRMAAYGGLVFGPAATTWFSFLQRRVVLGGKYTTILARVGLDQLIFTPTNLFCFLSSMAIMEGTSPKAKLKSTYETALKKNWMIWPGVQFVNFAYVPLEYRVLLVNGVSLGWNCECSS
jgi:protein Mpv17